MRSYPHISSLLFDQPWAIVPRTLDSMISRLETHDVDLDAVATKLGRPLENTGNRVEQRGSTAILDINGPIVRYANLFSMVSGLTSVEMLARDFRTAAENPLVDNILLRVDSPGGEVNGIAEFAALIRASPKPVTAYIDGLGASAAYWLASAASKIYGSVDSFSGSIGVVATLTDRKGAQERQGVKTYTIVSSQSPRKVPDPATEDGSAAIQEMVDSLGALFVEDVARYRNVSADHVLGKFGKGFVLPARLAEQAGMIDGVTSEEALIASLNPKTMVAGTAANQEVITMAPNNPAPPAADPAAVGAELRQKERQRIQAILALPEALKRPTLAQALAFEPDMSVEAAQRILAAAPEAAAAPANPLDAHMSQLKNPNVGVGTEEPDTAEAEAKRILAFVPTHHRAKAS